jgi:amino acid transporter
VPFTRNISLGMAVMIGIGAMMGPWIFALPGPLAERVGPLGILSYLALALMVVPTALNYAELGAAIPLAGGGYSFVSRTLPKTVAFLTGWFFWIGNVLAASMYVLIFALTVRESIWSGAPVVVISIAVTAFFLYGNLRGASQSLVLIAWMNAVEIAILGAFAIGAMWFVDVQANLVPVAPLGVAPFAGSMALIYVSFVGFDLITVASEEIIAPSRTIPRAIFITLAVGAVIYVVVVGMMMGSVHWSELATSDVPFIYAADKLFGGWGRWAGITATIMASLSAFSVTLGASARILYALSRDGHLPKILTKLHPSYRTPHVALVVCAVVVVAFSSSGLVALVASVAAFGYLLGQGVVNLSVIALDETMPNLRRPFRVWWFPRMPLVGAVSCWVFIPALEWEAFTMGAGLTGIGAIVYLTKRDNRVEAARAPAAIYALVTRLLRRRKQPMRVLIVSGGQLGQSIADRLLAKDAQRMVFRSHEHQITFIEQDEDLCKRLEDRYSVPIFQGDGTKREVLLQVGVDNVDVVVAASNDDGRNIIIAMQAKRLEMRKVIAIMQDPEYVELLTDHGIVAISAPWTTAGLVENHLDRPGVVELFEIETGTAHLLGVIVPEGSKAANMAIRDLTLPPEIVVAAVIRHHDFVVPRGDTRILVGDHVVFVGPVEAVKDARDRFLALK